MRFIFIYVLLVFSLAYLSCATTKNILSKEKVIDNIIIKEPKDVIFEINVEHTSPVDYLSEKILYFRLYKDGFIEFDDYPSESKNGKKIILEENKTLKQFKIKESKLLELKNLLSDSEYKNLKNKYEKIVSSCDAIPKVEVKKEDNKIIEISWCDSLITPHNSPEFPQILVKLFQEIHKIKSDALGKQAPYL